MSDTDTTSIPAGADDERWLRIPGASQYEVSSLGRIRSYVTLTPDGEPYVMRLALSDGYPTTRLVYDDGVARTTYAHRAVAAAFFGPRPEGMVAAHRNDCRTDCRVENLHYVTQTANMREAVENGCIRRGPRPHTWGRRSRLTVATVRAIRARLEAGIAAPQVAEETGASEATVRAIAYGRAYAWVGRDAAETAAIRLEAEAQRREAEARRRAQHDPEFVAGLARLAPPAGQKRGKQQRGGD